MIKTVKQLTDYVETSQTVYVETSQTHYVENGQTYLCWN